MIHEELLALMRDRWPTLGLQLLHGGVVALSAKSLLRIADGIEAEERTACAIECAAKVAQFQFCINRVAEALGNVCCGGVDSSPEDQMADPYSTTRVLVDAIDRLRTGDDALRAFAQQVMKSWPEGDVDGGDLQDAAEKHGLLKPERRYEPCVPVCSCIEYHGDDEWRDGVTCYRKTPLLTREQQT